MRSAASASRSSFEHDGANYQVFDGTGNAWPPQVCVDFVVDTFERTSGTWWRPRGASLGRARGKLDFAEAGISSRRGVIAFGQLAEQKPDTFDVRRFRDRIFARAAIDNDSMPPGPDDPSLQERIMLADWLTCGAPEPRSWHQAGLPR